MESKIKKTYVDEDDDDNNSDSSNQNNKLSSEYHHQKLSLDVNDYDKKISDDKESVYLKLNNNNDDKIERLKSGKSELEQQQG